MGRSKKDFKFDRRAAKYDEGFEGRFSRRFYRLMLGQVKLKPGDIVLDVGCGTGILLRKMSDICPINGYGIDVEANMIAEAKQKCPDMNIQIAKCEKIPFNDRTFDVVTACMAYHHFPDRKGFAKEAARILKPGGLLYIADPRFPAAIRKPLNAVMRHANVTGEFFTADEIIADFKAYGFESDGFAADGYAQVVNLRMGNEYI